MRISHRLFPVLLMCAVPLTTRATDLDGAGYWRETPESSLGARAESRRIVPDRYRTLTLDLEQLRVRLAAAPLEFTHEAADAPLLLALPMPGGEFERFRVVASPIMEPGLSKKFPFIKTYRGQGVDDPTATARFDLTEMGFHAQVLGAGRADYIDPYASGDRDHYIAYRRNDYSHKTGEITPFRCDVLGPERDMAAVRSRTQPLAPIGSTLHDYRLAVAATGEYTTAACLPNPVAVVCGMSAIVTTVNRVTGIYEREIAVRLTLVSNNNVLVYTNGATDPYTNSNGGTMLTQNQTNLGNVIGSANYDIGHVFSTGGGSTSVSNGVCSSASKAKGCTGRASPVGDPFDVDYVAHEMGHQIGADHTFNGTTGTCGGGLRVASWAYEPGSGSTIMGLAGNCGAENLQAHSDPYFHTKSIDQIVAFLDGVLPNCDVETATGNAAPSISAGGNFTIPRSTPFTLTAAATDPDGDALTYGWEESDLGSAAPPNDDAGGARPIFRSMNPTVSPSRTFPKLADVLAGSLGTNFEILPSIDRTMTFRVTARDNRAGGGGVNSASMQVTVSSAAGPFAVTAPDTAVTWPALSTQTVTWNVAGTDATPVSAASVDILLSTDGGTTFPGTLAATVPNNGSANVTIPGILTTTARVKVQAVGNIFFDISNTNFIITAPAPITEASPAGDLRLAKGAGTAVTATYTAACGATDHVVYRGVGPIAGTLSWSAAYCAIGVSGSASFDPGTPATGQLHYFAIVGQNSAAEGSYGRNSLGTERPEAIGVGSCDRPRNLGGICP